MTVRSHLMPSLEDPSARLALVALAVITCLATLVASARPAQAAAAAGGHYHSLASPLRLLDTRNGTGRPGGPVPPGSSFDLAVVGSAVPADGVAAVLSVTVTDSTDSGFLTVWPAGNPLPVASSLNWGSYQQVSNLVTTGIGTGGRISFYLNHSQSHLIADLYGYYSGADQPGGEYRPLMSARILDTRSGVGAPAQRLAAGSVLSLQVAGRGNVPATGVSAVVLQVTAAGPSHGSYLAVYPYGQSVPVASSVIFTAGRNVGSRVIVGLSQGRVDIYQSEGDTDVVADVNGYFTDSSIPAAGGLFVPLQPVRVLDTRAGVGHSGSLGPGQAVTVAVAAPAAIPAGSAAAVINLTSTEAGDGTYLTAYPAGNARTLSSDVNAAPGPPVPNLSLIKLTADGQITIFNSAGSGHVLGDVVGYYTQAPAGGTLPSAPQSPAATPGDRSAALTWASPADTGGSEIVSWAIEVSSGAEVVAPASALSATLAGLTNTVSYSFRVIALNATGSGAQSAAATATPIGTPDPPVGLVATPGAGSIALTWGAPANDGGSPVQHYRITISPGNQLIGFPGTSITLSGLAAQYYSFTVQSVNAYGAGPGSSAGPVAPLGLRRIVVSIGQQALVAYNGGQVVLQTLVTTGRPELPTPLGSYRIFLKQSPFHFISPWGPSSPFWYQDAWVSWAMEFIDGGYFVHDAPWRGWYGPGSNNGDGTHGCVNVPHDAMAFLYGWAQNGDEVDVVG